METTKERIPADLKKLSVKGAILLNAIQTEQFPEQMEAHFKKNLQKDFEAFKKALPSFVNTYQSWYSEALVVVKQFLPNRVSDFTSLYEPSKARKDLRQDNYVIEDYLKGITVTTGYDKKIVAGPSDAVPLFQQQLNILNSVNARLESSLFDIERLIQSEILESELHAARLLAKNHFYRSAGAICGVVLEKHLDQVRENHSLKIGKKNPSINDYNELFKKHEVYDFPQWRFIQFLNDIRDLCCRDKKNTPGPEDLNDLIAGVEKVIKTVF